MIVAAAHHTARTQYAFGLIASLLGRPLQMIYPAEAATRPTAGFLVWYLPTPPPPALAHACWLQPHTLLTETHICPQNLAPGTWQGMPTLFAQAQGTLPFDLGAAVFYLAARYEEYLPFMHDVYGRYPYTQSAAYTHGFLEIPLINKWVHALARHYGLALPPAPPHSQSFDVDMAYRFLAQPFWRQLGQLAKMCTQGQLNTYLEIRSGKRPDPFDVFAWISQHTQPQHTAYFLLLSRRRHRLDRNNVWQHKKVKALVQKLGTVGSLHWHPGVEASEHPQAFVYEQKAFARLTGHAPTASRYHYLHFVLPHGYRALLDAGITEDYSMGYGEANGFRASLCSPFFWFDLMRNQETPLRIHPFGWMDANAIFEHKLSPAQAAAQLQQMYAEAEACGCGLHTVWHNHFLAEEKWRWVWESKL